MLLDVLASLRQNVSDVETVLLLAESGPLVEKTQALGTPVRIVELPPALAGWVIAACAAADDSGNSSGWRSRAGGRGSRLAAIYAN